MALKMKKIEEEALQLSSHERAQLAEHLIHSLHEEEDPEAERLFQEIKGHIPYFLTTLNLFISQRKYGMCP